MSQARIAFFAPLKPPDHPIPSGDRQMARMLFGALVHAGYDTFLASRLISYSKRSGVEYMRSRMADAHMEADRLIEQWRLHGGTPDLWFCYHPYDKSPDWLGMEVCTRLGIPMVTAEPCKTEQGDKGEWMPWRHEAQKAIGMSDMNIVLTPTDREYLLGFVDPEKITVMDPFVVPDLLEERAIAEDPWKAEGDTARLLAVGMMRPGKKITSYEILAEALGQMKQVDWSLVIAGDGPDMAQVKEKFANAVGVRAHFVSGIETEEILGLMSKADILSWPGYMEAFGMVYLEAASRGVPAVAINNLGTPLVVLHEKTGLLADPKIPGSYAAALTRLIKDTDLRKRLGAGGINLVRNERSVDMAAKRLREIIDPILEKSRKVR